MYNKELKAPSGGNIGTQYGSLVITSIVSYGRKARVMVRCECGYVYEIGLTDIKQRVAKNIHPCCPKCRNKITSDRVIARFDLSKYIGKRFGRLLVTGLDVDKTRKSYKSRLVCRCDCGSQHIVAAVHLNNGSTTSCGCYHSERLVEVGKTTNLIHGNTTIGELNGHTSLYRSWMKIKICCKAGKDKGIGLVSHEYDPRWEKFDEFLKDFGRIGRYQTISRIDNKHPWSKENCFVNVGRRHLFETKES